MSNAEDRSGGDSKDAYPYCQEPNGYHLQLLEVMSSCYGELGIQVEQYCEDFYSSNDT